MTEIREVLRAWLADAGLRRVAEQAGVDRKTARRYVEAGLVRAGGAGQLTDELIGQVAQAARPACRRRQKPSITHVASALVDDQKEPPMITHDQRWSHPRNTPVPSRWQATYGIKVLVAALHYRPRTFSPHHPAA